MSQITGCCYHLVDTVGGAAKQYPRWFTHKELEQKNVNTAKVEKLWTIPKTVDKKIPTNHPDSPDAVPGREAGDG